ncbi:MAG: glucose 1-dehydrogenase [Cyclobacteriaceae bacterium]
MSTFRLDGKVAIVTGGAKGIGLAISKKLAEQGASVHLIDVDANGLEVAIAEIRESGGIASAYSIDITKKHEVDSVFNEIGSQLDILINNAGIAHVGNVEATSEEDFDQVFQVNVKGAFHCLRAAVTQMKKSGGGSIVNIASIAATVGLSDRFAYSASKGAILTMTYSIAKDYLSNNIRCNAISPGRVHTPFLDGFIAKNYPDNQDETFEKLAHSQPIGRMGQPEEIASLALYLSADESSFVTGSNYVIDGGLTTLNTK